MIAITYAGGKTATFRIGQITGDLNIENVSKITVSESDLETIKNQYSKKVFIGLFNTVNIYSIPVIENKSSMTWYGDIARTILYNL